MRSIGLLWLVSAVALAQPHSGAVVRSGSYRTAGPPAGFTGSGGPVYAGSGRPATAGRGFNYGTRPIRPRASGAVVYVPYAVGGYGYYGPEDYSAPVTYPNQEQPAAPTVIINQNFIPQTANPIVREYVPDENGGIHVYRPGQPAGEPADVQPQENAAADNPTFLIAFKDHTIYAAVAYWIEGDTLHYVTSGNRHNQVSLDLVDRELSARLNGERGVDFRLPPPGR